MFTQLVQTIHVLTTECTNKAHKFSMVVKPESNKLILSLHQIVLLLLLYQAGKTYPRSGNKLNNRSIGRDLWSRKLKESIFEFFSLLVYSSFPTYPHKALFFVNRQSSKNHVSIKILLNHVLILVALL